MQLMQPLRPHTVLGLVEPESSGLGGGGFMVVYQQADKQVKFYDGRETAPAGATVDMFMRDGSVLNYFEGKESGHAVGVPGAVALYKLAHDAHGRLPWDAVFSASHSTRQRRLRRHGKDGKFF